MGANQSCTMCVNPSDYQKDHIAPRRKVKGGLFMSSSSSESSSSSSYQTSPSSISLYKQKVLFLFFYFLANQTLKGESYQIILAGCMHFIMIRNIANAKKIFYLIQQAKLLAIFNLHPSSFLSSIVTPSPTQNSLEQEQPNYQKCQLQSKIDIKGTRNREQQKQAKPQDFQPEKSFSYDFTNFAYCREELWMKAIMETYQDDLKNNKLEIVGNTENNNNNSQLSGQSLLNQLCELDSPKEGLKARNFKMILQTKDQVNSTQSTSTNSRNKRNNSTTQQNSTIKSKNQTISSYPYQKDANMPNLGQFEKIKLLCETKQSQVYLVQKDKVPLAMKIIKKSQLKYQNQIENIWRERRILERLDSSYTVRLEYAFADAENIYLVTDYKPHGTLKQYLLKKKKEDITLKEIKRIIAQTVACLQYLHEEQNILYRGLQLDNILMDELMNVSLCDFGNSKIMRSKRQINTSFVFDMKEENQSPEQARQKHQDTSSDYWQLGILVYQLIYRRHPFIGENRKQTLSNIQNCTSSSIIYPIFSFNKEQVTCEFIEFIQYCLTVDKAHRPHTFYDIQQTSLFTGYEWQEVLEMYTSKYSQHNDNLHRCAQQQLIHNNQLYLSCDYNPHFLNSINHDSLLDQNYPHHDEDIATTIALPTSHNLNNHTNYTNHTNNTNNTNSSGSKITTKMDGKIKRNQRSQIESSQNDNDHPQYVKEEFISLQQSQRKKRNTLSCQESSKQVSLTRSQHNKLQKQNNSIDGDDENDPNEEDSFVVEKTRQQKQQMKQPSKQISQLIAASDKKD